MSIYKTIFEANPDGIIAVDDAGAILLANRAAEAMFGYAPGSLPGRSIEDLVPLPVAARHAGHRASYCQMPKNRPMGATGPLMGRRHDGELFYVDIMLSPVELEAGRATLCVVRDATRRVNLERHMHLANTVFKTTQEAIVVTDQDCVIVAVNPAFERVTEYAASEVVGQNIRLLRSGKHDVEFFRHMWNQINATGEWEGQIWNRRKSGEVYQEWLSVSTVRDSAGAAVQYVGISADMTRINHAETPTEHMAHYDALTGLPNRLLLQSRLEKTLAHAHRERRQFALLYLDLDGFKEVNDRLGHAIGDQLLIQVGMRLGHAVRETDTVARFGGDEFVVVLEDVHREDVEVIAQGMIDRIRLPFNLGDAGIIHVGLSLGWSLYPDDAADAISLIQLADIALYHAKRTGRGRWVAFGDIDHDSHR